MQPTPFPIPAKSTTDYLPRVDNLILTKKLLLSLPLLVNQFTEGLDLVSEQSVDRLACSNLTSDGQSLVFKAAIEQANGFVIPALKYDQDDVPYRTLAKKPDHDLFASNKSSRGIDIDLALAGVPLTNLGDLTNLGTLLTGLLQACVVISRHVPCDGQLS